MGDSNKYWQSINEKVSDASRVILNEYLLSLKLANKAERTIETYRKLLEQFFIMCPTPLERLTSNEVLRQLNEYSQNKKTKTITLFISTLSSFFKFCVAEDYLKEIVIKKRWRPKVPESLPKYLNEQEFAQVKLVTEGLSIRDRALVLFLFSSGCRRSEVSQLTIQDIDIDRRTAKVKGKGKRIRHIHFSEECALILKEYLGMRHFKKTDPLFVTRTGRPLQGDGIYEVTKRLGEKASLPYILHPHCCRHTFAYNMVLRGAPLEFIAAEMGHENLNTTRIYARIPTEDMIQAYQNKMG
ncbi:tyrosine-type recombinase/integrase [Rossellomorea sp. SC111]|uniref:tyrosine-type recombinase/integrase n=1 Tax=Rossellomorea sp. SC111 TaxID=2968985 RepID=UPI00215A2AB7|nr:tyrosine-type recombinase/integrase [Rossellomorea sp. SC111]MCR8847768.1 tyrosine-type recombinase/integrase [Rossellomorea sp. SC111]